MTTIVNKSGTPLN